MKTVRIGAKRSPPGGFRRFSARSADAGFRSALAFFSDLWYNNPIPYSEQRRSETLKTTERKGSFLEGAFILTVSTAFVKLAGLLFTFPIAGILGDGGMGVFYSAYNVYNLFAVLASA